MAWLTPSGIQSNYNLSTRRVTRTGHRSMVSYFNEIFNDFTTDLQSPINGTGNRPIGKMHPVLAEYASAGRSFRHQCELSSVSANRFLSFCKSASDQPAGCVTATQASI
ncbi:hypothetical protein CA85_28610 [Allorhodopirellula solitaria]|uniref:Uncharacterized protein n=1 Tax=Allorhodopirellula solitaria TaxID=2527987 RepID=A0A5C5XWI3_9BACT|nr:hypothetical protein CA85_28610 [Allorhodopirellula solitaria]